MDCCDGVSNTMSDEENTAFPRDELRPNSAMEERLKDNHPDVLRLLRSQRECIKKQQTKIRKLKSRLAKRKEQQQRCVGTDIGVQTDSLDDPEVTSTNITDEIVEAAELAMRKTGFVYEETSGLYYDYNSGYYYNAELGLYYDGNAGTYMTYNNADGTYEFHSQAEVANSTTETVLPEKPKRHTRKNRKPTKVITSSDMGDLTQLFNRMNIQRPCKISLEIARGWPPCMRIIVKCTSVPKLKEGTLYLLTYQGGTLGREGDHAITIPDINVSKHHLKFVFDHDHLQGGYRLVDLGSRNGTFLNGERVSPSKQESAPVEVSHGSSIRIGSTTLLCHIHSGNETCGHCEPGLVQTAPKYLDSPDRCAPASNKSERHKSELRKLRKKFGIVGADCDGGSRLATGYTDRAQARRLAVGSHNEHEKTHVASLDESIPADNKGFKLLSKMGWSQGQALGKEGTGVLNPVELTSTLGTTGIGYGGGGVVEKIQTSAPAENVWEKTQIRYRRLSDSVQPSTELD